MITDNINYGDDPRWIAIRDFPLDEPEAGLPFSRRLARENGWTKTFADRVIEEYRRFCYIAVRTKSPVTPSEEVDQAWHLHLLYSRSYWKEFCPNVLKTPFHHGPTRGGPKEGAKFHDWYTETLKSYEAIFGAAPPTDIWPPAAERFRDAAAYRRVNLMTNWVIPIPRTLLALDRVIERWFG